MSLIRVAILTVSDTASLDAKADRSGPAIKEILESRKGLIFSCDELSIVPDDKDRIQSAIRQWVDQGGIDLIVTTGGTGFGVRDITPEAVSALIERPASGLVHLLLSASFKHTPRAALARPVAGTIKSTLIVTLPGSPKAVKENLDALMIDGVLDHAVELIRGGKGEKAHAEMTAAASSDAGGGHGHHHHHHHHHHHDAPQAKILSHDPSAPASARHRVSPYPLTSLEDALDIIQSNVSPLETRNLRVTHLLGGYILAEDVHATQNVPLTPTTSVDGYAVRSTDPPGIYKVVTPQTHALSTTLPTGMIYRINTGAPLPAGTDTVVMVEDTRLISTSKNADGTDGEENEVEILVQNPPGEYIRVPGSDVKTGELVLKRGEQLHTGGGEIGTLAFVGRKQVDVFKKPVVALLSTGDEIVDIQSSEPKSGEWSGIFDTNRPSLQTALEGMGYEVLDLGVVPDQIDAHVKAIQKGLERADLLLTTGGTSMGPSDLLKPVIERQFKGTVHFGRVSVKPGKPTTFATIPFNGTMKPAFALPGNPASALVTFYVFVVPALRKLGGWPAELCQLPRAQVQVQDAMELDARTEFHRVVIKAGKNGLQAFSTGGQRSSRMVSLSGANGLVVLPQNKTGKPARLEAGENAEAVIIGELQML